MKKIYIAPPFHTELINYTSWLDENDLPYIVSTNLDELKPEMLLLLCGGGDIAKKKARDDFEFKLLEVAQRQGNKVVGICRGMQISNIFLGGSLITELDGKSRIAHRNPKDEKGDRESTFHLVHEIGLNKKIFKVNSRHHQSIGIFGKGLRPTTWSIDFVFESSESEDGRYFLVQWHPEREEVRGEHCSDMVINFMKNWFKVDIAEKEEILWCNNLCGDNTAEDNTYLRCGCGLGYQKDDINDLSGPNMCWNCDKGNKSDGEYCYNCGEIL